MKEWFLRPTRKSHYPSCEILIPRKNKNSIKTYRLFLVYGPKLSPCRYNYSTQRSMYSHCEKILFYYGLYDTKYLFYTYNQMTLSLSIQQLRFYHLIGLTYSKGWKINLLNLGQCVYICCFFFQCIFS